MKLQTTLSGDGHGVIQEKGTIAPQYTAYLTTDKAISTAGMHIGSEVYLVYVCVCMLVCCVCG